MAVGVLAGATGSAGGITSLASYPALLLLGMAPLVANVTNNAAMCTVLPGSMLASASELAGRRAWLSAWTPLMALGGLSGAVLLLLTPPGVFALAVPWLVLTGVVALLAQPWLSRRRAGREARGLLGVTLVPIGLYTGYFGAGAGVMVLTAVLVLVESRLPTANALKNVLVGVATLGPALLFMLARPVRWTAAVPLAIGFFIGGRLGPAIVRRAPHGLIRGAIIALGLILFAELLS